MSKNKKSLTAPQKSTEQKQEEWNYKVVAQNKKARFDYHIVETFEAGIVLKGHEVKSIRDGGLSLAESYVRPDTQGMWLLGAHIRQNLHSGGEKLYDPVRSRKLLLHKREIEKLSGKASTKGFTIVPLRAYIKRGNIKIEIALAKGKDAPDKREAIKEREVKREAARFGKKL
jgi:SsrA-binding protein